jgi:hypothetical protein
VAHDELEEHVEAALGCRHVDGALARVVAGNKQPRHVGRGRRPQYGPDDADAACQMHGRVAMLVRGVDVGSAPH